MSQREPPVPETEAEAGSGLAGGYLKTVSEWL